MALRRFDLEADQPHPPGYALYVFLSKIAFAVCRNPLVALTSVSAISGGMCLLPVYAVVKKMHDHQTAVVTCLALMSTRMFWLTIEKAITHMLGTFLITLAICLLYLGLTGERRFLLISWPALGFALGARPSYFPFLALWLYGGPAKGRRIGPARAHRGTLSKSK
jgi:4-amino-4-deoxy-L-arabinose transferase-like glycosyltransferase